jgi:hypothetical protein
VATAGNISRSLRSLSPAPPRHHFDVSLKDFPQPSTFYMSQTQPEIEALHSENRDLRAKLEAYRKFSETFDKQGDDFIFHFFKEDKDISIEDLMRSFDLKRCICEALISKLTSKGMIKDHGSRPLPRYHAEPEVFTSLFCITHKGTEWAMANQ